jgi:hypothetical protein
MRKRTGKPKVEPRIWKTSEVFVAGDVPTVTYNPRDERHLEQEVLSYRDQPGKALSVSGPSKSGKTVLIERLFPTTSAVWVQGSDLDSADRFWQRLADGLNLFDQISFRGEQAEGRSRDTGASVGVPKVAGADTRWGTSSTTTTAQVERFSQLGVNSASVAARASDNWAMRTEPWVEWVKIGTRGGH